MGSRLATVPLATRAAEQAADSESGRQRAAVPLALDLAVGVVFFLEVWGHVPMICDEF